MPNLLTREETIQVVKDDIQRINIAFEAFIQTLNPNEEFEVEIDNEEDFVWIAGATTALMHAEAILKMLEDPDADEEEVQEFIRKISDFRIISKE